MDSTVFPDSPALRRIISHHNKETLIDIVKEWLSIYPFSRIHEDEDNDDEEWMDLDDRPKARSTRSMTTSKYQKHVVKQYDSLRDKAQKKRIVDRMLSVEWSTGLNARQVAELDLRYYMQHPNLKSWKAMKLEYDPLGE
jgi:centromere protein N